MNRQLVKRVIFPVHEWLKGKPTHALLRELERTQWVGPDALADVQFRRLRRHLEFAYREVPYYTRLLDEHEIHPDRITSLEDFRRIPFLTKDIIRRCFRDLQPRTRIRGVRPMSTGGSTGTPVTVLVDAARAAFTDAARLRAHRWFGVDMGAREVVLWGSPIELTKQDRIRALRDRLLNSRLLSAFDLGEQALAAHAEALERDRPEKLYGYASALALLAGYLNRRGWKARDGWPRVVFTTAEPLYDFQRSAIESVFGCAVAVEYGARDAGLIATECPEGGLHIPAEGMFVETIGDYSNGGGAGGELVVTNLYSFAMPLIRYRTGDVGALHDLPCPCGRSLPRLARVEGRRTDFLVSPGGKVMHALAVVYVLREVGAIREFQVIQERLDWVRVTVVPDTGFSEAAREGIAARITALFDGAVDVTVEVVEAIARPPSAKYRYVISRVSDEYLDSLLTVK